MKKYINGKIIEISEEDSVKTNEHFKNFTRKNNIVTNVSNYENRIGAIEKSIKEILSKLNKNK